MRQNKPKTQVIKNKNITLSDLTSRDLSKLECSKHCPLIKQVKEACLELKKSEALVLETEDIIKRTSELREAYKDNSTATQIEKLKAECTD